MPAGRRLYAIILAAALLIPSGFFAWRYRSMPQLASYHDDSVYWLSAQSLAQGHGYRIGHLPERPAQTKYPPLYPALLSMVWRLTGPFPGNLPVVTAVQWAFVPICLFLAWLYFRRCGFSMPAAYGMTLAIAAGPMTIVFSVSPMTELPFTTLLLIVMLLVERDARPGHAFLAGCIAAAAFLTRTNGIVLVASVPLIWMFQRKFRSAAAFALPMLAAIVGWQGWCLIHMWPATDNIISYYTSYVGFYIRTFSLPDLPARLWVNADAVIGSLARLVLFNTGELLWLRLAGWVITAAAISGIVILYRRGFRQYPAFAVLFVITLLLWQYPPDQRFVYPILPLYLAGLVTKLTEIGTLAVTTWKQTNKRFAPALVLSMIFLIAAGCAALTAQGIFVRLPSYFEDREIQRARMMPVYRWIASSTDPDLYFAAYNDTLLFLYTGRRGYTEPILPATVYSADPDAASKYVLTLPALWREKHVAYVLETDWDFQRDLHAPGEDSLNLLLRDRSRFQPVYDDPFARVYRFLPESSRSALLAPHDHVPGQPPH